MEHWMQNRNRTLVILSVVALFVAGVCLAGAVVGGVSYLSGGDDLIATAKTIFTQQVRQSQDVNLAELPSTPLDSEVDLKVLFQPFWESRQLLHDNFVDQPIDDEVLAGGAVDGLAQVLEGYELSLDDVDVPEDAPDAATLAAEAGTPAEALQQFMPFWEQWRAVAYLPLDEDLTYELLMRESLRGMVASLGDLHTAYMDPFEYQQTQMDLEGEYEGIGAWVDTTAEYLTIVSPMEGSPAEQVGLQPGDRIVAVDGEDMTGIDGNLVIRRLLGPSGTKVVLTIERDSESEPFDVEVTRAHIVVPTVVTDTLDGDIAYIQLTTFGADSYEQLHAALEEALALEPAGLILDLRNNAGGYLHVAINITSDFVADGPVVFEEYGDGRSQTYEAHKGGIATEIPMVVLVNQGSASASEILAGALQDYQRAELVGMTTYGKGSVQLPITLADNQGALRITIAKWLTPDKRTIHEIGIEPDVVVDITQEDVDAGIDPQLEKAIELLTSP